MIGKWSVYAGNKSERCTDLVTESPSTQSVLDIRCGRAKRFEKLTQNCSAGWIQLPQ